MSETPSETPTPEGAQPQDLPLSEAGGPRTYVILRAGADDSWQKVAELAAGGREAALQAYGGSEGAQEGEYVAIPSRSWQPAKLSIARETKVSLG